MRSMKSSAEAERRVRLAEVELVPIRLPYDDKRVNEFRVPK